MCKILARYYKKPSFSYFYDSAYKPVKRDYALPIDECGKCALATEIIADDKTSKGSGKTNP